MQRKAGMSIGFVPTMGALHEGHISLINKALEENDRVVCSIFVNPTQFTEASDLENYPRPINEDIRLLEQAGCHIFFHPSVSEMYAPSEEWEYEIGTLEQIYEGAFRPGHFQGVAQIVSKLFGIVQPDKAYFGQKDYQQFLVIKKLAEDFKYNITLIACPIIRENDGLAMSSRNRRLNPVERKNAASIYKVLAFIKENFGRRPLEDLLRDAGIMLEQIPDSNPEYLAIADGDDLREIINPDEHKRIVAIVAIRIGAVRLIDNIILKS